MALTDYVSGAIGRVVGRLVRRAMCWVLVGVFGLAAVYQGSVAAVLALEATFGAFYAHLMIAGFYALLAISFLVFLRLSAQRPLLDAEYRKSLAKLPAEAQVATVIEAMLLGYAMARRK
jgi:hypothetical protein